MHRQQNNDCNDHPQGFGPSECTLLDHLLFSTIVCEIEKHLMLSGKTEANRPNLCRRAVQLYVPAMSWVSLGLS